MYLDQYIRNSGRVTYGENELLYLEFKTDTHHKTDFKSNCVSCDLETARTDKTPDNANAITFSCADIHNRFAYVTTHICDYESLFDTMCELFLNTVEEKTDILRVYFHNLDFDGYFKLCYLLRKNYKQVTMLTPKTLKELKETDGENTEYFSTLINNNSIIEIRYSYKGKIFQCLDTYKIWATSLDEVSQECYKINKTCIKNGKPVKFPLVQLKKKETKWDYESQRTIGTLLDNEELEYSFNDVLVTNCIYTIFSEFVGDLKLTIASTAFSVCEKSYFDGVFTHEVLTWFLKKCTFTKDTTELNSKRFKYFFHVERNDKTKAYDFYSKNYQGKHTEKEFYFSIPFDKLKDKYKTTLRTVFTNYTTIMSYIHDIPTPRIEVVEEIACKQSIFFRTYYKQHHFETKDNLFQCLRLFFVPTANDKKAKLKANDVTTKQQRKLRVKLTNEIFPPFTKEQDNHIRPSYRGGITQCNELYQNNLVHNVFGLDINSSYPDKMANWKLPIGQGTSYNHFVSESDDTVVLYRFRCDFKLKKGHLPYVATKSFLGNARFTPNDTIENQISACRYIYMFANELELFKLTHEVGEIIFFESIVYQADKAVFYGFIDKMYLIKTESKGTAIYVPAKVLMNSVYGRFAMDIFRINEKVDDIYYSENDILCFGTKDNEEYDDTKLKGLYLIMASYITACARVHLMTGCHDIVNNGGTVFYMDTDSLYFTADEVKVNKKNDVVYINNRPTSIKCNGSILGEWDLEHGIQTHETDEFIYYRGETEGKFLCPKRYYLYEKSFDGAVDKDGNPKNPYTIRCAGVTKDEQKKINRYNFDFGYKSIGLQKHRHSTGVELAPTEKVLSYSNYIYKTDKGNVISTKYYKKGDKIENIYREICIIESCIYDPTPKPKDEN